ncbi:DUF2560 family protein [Escherichia coli]|uniref:DUF2560 family protein n=1 Tax=Escherichia coli TaxID=562 RepID=UPI001CDB0ABF|nr:DUF2560 family protein [Escherichia coli]
MIWQPEFTDKTLSRKPGAVQVMNQNAAAEEAFQFIGTDELKLELFKIHFQSGGANSDITIRTFEAVRKSKEALDLFTTGA